MRLPGVNSCPDNTNCTHSSQLNSIFHLIPAIPSSILSYSYSIYATLYATLNTEVYILVASDSTLIAHCTLNSACNHIFRPFNKLARIYYYYHQVAA
jgi:hypothetical protein